MEHFLRVYKQLTTRVESQAAAHSEETDATTSLPSLMNKSIPTIDVSSFAETDAIAEIDPTDSPSYSAVENDEHWVPTHGYEFDDVFSFQPIKDILYGYANRMGFMLHVLRSRYYGAQGTPLLPKFLDDKSTTCQEEKQPNSKEEDITSSVEGVTSK